MDLLNVQAELLAREPIFHKPEFGTTREDYAQTADDFWEVGASGQAYQREYVLEQLARRGRVASDDDWIVSDVHCRELGEGTFATTYRLDQAGRLTSYNPRPPRLVQSPSAAIDPRSGGGSSTPEAFALTLPRLATGPTPR